MGEKVMTMLDEVTATCGMDILLGLMEAVRCSAFGVFRYVDDAELLRDENVLKDGYSFELHDEIKESDDYIAFLKQFCLEKENAHVQFGTRWLRVRCFCLVEFCDDHTRMLVLDARPRNLEGFWYEYKHATGEVRCFTLDSAGIWCAAEFKSARHMFSYFLDQCVDICNRFDTNFDKYARHARQAIKHL